MLTALLLVTEDDLGFITMMVMVKRANLISCTDLHNYRKLKNDKDLLSRSVQFCHHMKESRFLKGLGENDKIQTFES